MDTKPERAIRSLLHAAGFRFRKDHRIDMRDVRVRPDVVFTRQRLAVFVDGCFWHRCPEHGVSPAHNTAYWTSKLNGNVERDRRVDAALADAGWTVFRFWEHEEPKGAVDQIIRRLLASRGHSPIDVGRGAVGPSGQPRDSSGSA